MLAEVDRTGDLSTQGVEPNAPMERGHHVPWDHGFVVLPGRESKGSIILHLERSDVTVCAPLIGSAAFGGRQDSWLNAGGGTRFDLPVLSPRLLLSGDHEGKRTAPMPSRPYFFSGPFARGPSPKPSGTGVEATDGQGSGLPTASKQQDQGVRKVDVSPPSSLTLAIIGIGCCFAGFSWLGSNVR